MRTLAAMLLRGVFAACGASASTGGAQAAADVTTKAIYNDDYESVSGAFDNRIEGKITRGEVGALSDKLHALGAYKGLSFIGGDPAKNEYEYRADFDKGSVNVVVRLDSDGRLSAYRVL